MLMKNPENHTIKVSDLGIEIAPGGVAEIPDGYCRPRTAASGAKLSTIIGMLAPQLIPADEGLVAAWKSRTLDLEAPKAPSPTAADLQAQGVAPAVAAMMADGMADSVKQVNKSIPVVKAAVKPQQH